MAIGFDFSAGVLPSGATLARAAGSATYYNSSGALVAAGTNVARFDYNPYTLAYRGLLLEPAATNAALYSDDFSNAAYTFNLMTGTATGIRETTASGFHEVRQTFSYGAVSCMSVVAKLASGSPTRYLLLNTPGGAGSAIYDLAAGTTVIFGTNVTGAVAERVSATEFRCSMIYTNSASTGPFALGSTTNNNNNSSHTGVTTAGFDLKGFQFEAGSKPTSRIPTTSAAATRPADVLTLDWSSFGVPNGTITARYTFDDGSTQDVVTVIAGGVSVVPTNLNRPWITGVLGVGVTVPDTFNNPSIFPLLPGQMFPALKTPIWNTKIATAASGRERRRKQWAYPRWRFKIGHEVLRDTVAYPELQRLFAFFNANAGQYTEFSYFDAFDNAVVDQAFGTGDGTTTTFQLMRTGGAGAILFTEPVRSVISCKAKVAGTLATTTVNYGGTVTFATAPAAGAALTWTGAYMFLVRFEQDDMDASQLMQGLWSQAGLALITVKR
ncbi:DUF2460 domain-containing protein [Sphingomonas sp. HMP6]|uniref:DUF2460 domain-containing protein n=1 Tax=Sphingomonas sp. HMP6 TaxID=1517551 RepID=UPI001596AB17|nr:DUF2460 domain-containing protein [Sphingomonas sp. HMP6]BCA57678.1 hypothetical protein HMP06_0447 [Sphingomonas sp. HMP6]